MAIPVMPIIGQKTKSTSYNNINKYRGFNMKKIIILIVTMLLMLNLSACGHSIKDDLEINETPAQTLSATLKEYEDPNG